MKVLQVISHYVPAYRFGGPLQVAHALGKALCAQGHEVTVVATNQEDQSRCMDVATDCPIDVDGVRVYYCPVVWPRRWGYSPALGSRVSWEVANADMILVHSYFQYAGWKGAREARLRKRPYVVFPHGSLRRVAIDSSSGLAKRLYLRLLERGNFRSARFIAFNAQEELEDSLHAENGRVIPNGIDPAAMVPKSAPGEFRNRLPILAGKTCFLFLGRLDVRQKAVDVIVDAFARLAAMREDVALVLAGPSEGNDLEAIRDQVARTGCGNRIVFTGLLGATEKLAAFRDCDVFMMPSRYEGLSIALLEAMYCGLPVVVSDRVGLHKKITQNGCGLVVAPDAGEVLGALERMMDREVRRVAGERAHNLVVAEHTWARIAQTLLSEFSR